MPKDLFVTTNNMDNNKKYINGEFKYVDKKSSEQEAAYAEFMRKEKAVDAHHRTNIKGKEIEDSGLMDDFKTKLGDLTKFYQQEIPIKEDDVQTQIAKLDMIYEQLINSANTYISTRSNFWKKIWRFSQGYERLEMVKIINAKAQKERACLKRRAKYIVDNSKNINEDNGRPLWANVLAELQIEKLNLETNGGVSFKVGHHTGYGEIKKEKKIVATVEECRVKTKPCEYEPLNQYLIEDEG